MSKSAGVEQKGAHRVWRCPRCSRTLGEVYSGRVVIKAGDRYITFPVSAPVSQTCPKCSEVSSLIQEAA